MPSLDVAITVGEVQAVTVHQTSAMTQLINADAYYFGYSFREFTGTDAAILELLSGDTILGEVALPAGGADHMWLGPLGVACRGGVTVNVISGVAIGTVYIGYDIP
jgi:hypothetical protein